MIKEFGKNGLPFKLVVSTVAIVNVSNGWYVSKKYYNIHIESIHEICSPSWKRPFKRGLTVLIVQMGSTKTQKYTSNGLYFIVNFSQTVMIQRLQFVTIAVFLPP